MARTYEQERSVIMSLDDMRDQQNVQALKDAVSANRWSVAETASFVSGGAGRHNNRELATTLLREKGNDSPSKKQISNEMRNVQRWVNYEKGIRGKEKAREPSKASRELLARVGQHKDLAKNGMSIKLDGEIAVKGYRRNRKANVDLDVDQAIAFLENPSWEVLGEAYLNDQDSLYGFGDLDISFVTE